MPLSAVVEARPANAEGHVALANLNYWRGRHAEAIAGLRHNGTPLFIECIVASSFDEAARARFAKRKDLRLLEVTRNLIERFAPPR